MEDPKVTMGFYTTLWWTNIAIEKGPFMVDLPTKDGDVAQLCQFTRG